MTILVLNAGSSSLKYSLFREDAVVHEGIVEPIGETGGVVTYEAALREVEKRLFDQGTLRTLSELDAVGHRVVHGGERFNDPVLIDDEVIAAIEALIPLAPLHNPANLAGIRAIQKALPEVPQVAVFDTAFHRTMPETAWRYAIPDRLYRDYGIRKYGFHGISHAYVAKEAAKRLGKPLHACNLITLHLGNGASMCAIEGGRSVETSMGYTPLAGLVMGTRSGDIDPEIALWMVRQGLDAETILQRESGLKGLCGDNDMRRIEMRMMQGDERAKEAFAVFVHRIRHYLGAYMVALGRVDALVFTAGIGEHSAQVRAAVCRGLERWGIALDNARNQRGEASIETSGSPVRIFVIPTDEALEIARATRRLIKG